MKTGNQYCSQRSSQFTVVDMRRVSLNTKAKRVLYGVLAPTAFNQISSGQKTKEIWDRLEVTYKGTNRMKKNNISILQSNIELFKMEPDESIKDITV